MWQRKTLTVVAALAFSAGVFSLPARAGECQTSGKHCKRLEAIAAKLGLSDQQKEDIRKIGAEFHKKKTPLKEELGTLHREKREAMGKVLTEEQRGKVRSVIKAQWESKWQEIAAKLNLSDEQKVRIEKVREAYGKKFHDLAAQKDGAQERFRKLGREKRQAISHELTADQRAKFRTLVRAEKRHMRTPEARHEFWKGVGEKLGVTAEQKEQFKKIRADYAPKVEKAVTQLKSLHKEMRTAMKKVLTEEQRTKFREVHKARSEEKPAANSKG